MFKRLLLLATATALVVPAAALAAPPSTSVSGPTALVGRGAFRAELTAAAGAKPVRVLGRLGLVRFVDLGGDLKVTCAGKGKSRTTHNDQGQDVVTCGGLRGRAAASGSHFRIEGFALRFGLAIPDGYTGTVEGNVRARQAGAAGGQSPSQAQPGQVQPSSTRAGQTRIGQGRHRLRRRGLRRFGQGSARPAAPSAGSGLAAALANG